MDFYVFFFFFFYQKVCFVLCAETRLGFFFLLKRQCASFPFCGLKNRVGVLNILIKKWVTFIPWLEIGYFCVHV